MPIKNWPKEDRPREKLLAKGEVQLTDAELIAIFLRTGTEGHTALDMAKHLLSKYGGLKKLLMASQHELMQERGIGQARYATLKAALELGRRTLTTTFPVGTVIDKTQCIHTIFAERMRDYPSEVFACLFLDTHSRFMGFEELFYGTVNETNIYPREIIRRSLYYNAAKVIMMHNHPSGQTMPSAADRHVTKMIQRALLLMNIELIDHIIIGQSASYSFADAGYMV